MALSGQKELDTDFRVLWPDGTVRIIRTLALVQRDASGRPARMIGTNRDITEFRQTETEIRRLQAEGTLRQSEEAVLVAVAAERARLARELHDSVTQALFAATLKCEALQRSVESTTPQAAEMLVDLHRLTRGALAEMRTLLLEMRPDALGEVPLDELLRHLAVACESRARITVSLTTYGRLELGLDVKLALYRIAQEALNNVVRHAQATRAWLDLRCSAATLQLVIGDDGCGFEPSRTRPGQLGLRMMHERAAAAGALMRVETGPGRGTLVTLEWPGGEE
jgi:signal transduction histidine kinase